MSFDYVGLNTHMQHDVHTTAAITQSRRLYSISEGAQGGEAGGGGQHAKRSHKEDDGREKAGDRH